MTANASEAEHFVTLFDEGFVRQGLALHASLVQHHPRAILWVVCLTEAVERQLAALRSPRLNLLPLAALETLDLKTAKANRSRLEYIFTLTPFSFAFVLGRVPQARRVTYLDADLFFFHSPAPLLESFTASGASAMITEHGYAPEYQHLMEFAGRFCVQFLTVAGDEGGGEILRRWQLQCLENCGISLDGRDKVFGDQKYLNEWPERYGDRVYIYPEVAELLAPWNVAHHCASAAVDPIFYHFHSLRFFPGGWIEPCAGYNIAGAESLYAAYFTALRGAERALRAGGVIPTVHWNVWSLLRLGVRLAAGRTGIVRFRA